MPLVEGLRSWSSILALSTEIRAHNPDFSTSRSVYQKPVIRLLIYSVHKIDTFGLIFILVIISIISKAAILILNYYLFKTQTLKFDTSIKILCMNNITIFRIFKI